MNIQPYAIYTKAGMPDTYDFYYHAFKGNPMRCVFVNQKNNRRIYVDGYFISIDYREGAGDGVLEISYICKPDVHKITGIRTMDEHCFITYNGKKYTNMSELYHDFQNDQLSKEIDEALG